MKNEKLVPAVYVDGLTVAYREKPVLQNIAVSIPQGTIEAIVGPNGAGKSTLLKAILGIVPRMSGSILVCGEPFKRQHARIAYVPQRSAVDWDFPTTVFDVVLMGSYSSLGWIKRPGKIEKERTLLALEKTGMSDYAHRQISELSGGQQQRVFLARALVQEADIYFMDEPFQGVDAATEATLIVLLKELKNTGKTIVVVHHDLQTVVAYFDRVMLLNVQCIAEGAVADVFTAEHIQKTYGVACAVLPSA
ncbi:MAG: metal ABC transporter ATP-binding protein [Treponema sp.]|nr:metal ABC transporter ATP-binding protein [Treponema sp.]